MTTSLRVLRHPVFQMPRIITARLLALWFAAAAALLLTGCSALQLGYNQAHSVLYWWIDGHVDLNDAQSARLRQDIDAFLAWHRREELPAYAERLRQWRTLAAQDLSAEQVCSQVQAVHGAAGRAVHRSHEALTRLALSLSPAQLDHLQRHFAKGREGFEKDFLRGSAPERLDRRLERAVDRYETLYGPLSAAQQGLVRQSLQTSPFDPARSLAQRRDRQAELLRQIRQWQVAQAAQGPTGASVPRGTADALQDWLQRSLFAAPDARNDQAAWTRHGCQAFAELHNSTSAEQRRHAQRVLQGYEDDVRTLAGAS